MKMCFFHFMPYQQLPGNFEKDYHSVRVDAPGSLFGLKHGTRTARDCTQTTRTSWNRTSWKMKAGSVP
jgi:hypothetical protein